MQSLTQSGPSFSLQIDLKNARVKYFGAYLANLGTKKKSVNANF